MESNNNRNHITHNHVTTTTIISKRNVNKSHSNEIGLLTTMNSKVRVLLMALNVRRTVRVTKSSPGPRQPSIPGCFEVSTGFSEKDKTGCRAAWWWTSELKVSFRSPRFLVTPTSVFRSVIQ